MHGRVALLVVGLAATAVAFARPALADGTGDAFNNGEEIGAGAQGPGSAGGSSGGGGGGGGGGGSSPCRYERLDDAGQNTAEHLSDGGWGSETGPGEGAYYRRICDTGGGNTTASVVWLAEPPAAVVDPAQLAQQAYDQTVIPRPDVRLSPPLGQDQIVNVPTWMWLDAGAWQPVSASASAGGVTVVATAAPTSVRWDMGNGDVVTCGGPGTPYDPDGPSSQQSDCTYTYARSSAGQPGGAYTITVTTTWGVTWTVTGAPGGGSLGTAARTSTGTVRVAEIQALNE